MDDMMAKRVYLYLYDLIERTRRGGDNWEKHIGSYRSDASPPQIGSILIPGEFGIDPVQEYLVLEIVTTPEKRDLNILGDYADSHHVRVVLKKIKSRL